MLARSSFCQPTGRAASCARPRRPRGQFERVGGNLTIFGNQHRALPQRGGPPLSNIAPWSRDGRRGAAPHTPPGPPQHRRGPPGRASPAPAAGRPPFRRPDRRSPVHAASTKKTRCPGRPCKPGLRAGGWRIGSGSSSSGEARRRPSLIGLMLEDQTGSRDGGVVDGVQAQASTVAAPVDGLAESTAVS